ncbi:MAG: response regulator [Deltaproteobacteria bacterium]|nr:response regulator [Deltaproteobacteria bacterium]
MAIVTKTSDPNELLGMIEDGSILEIVEPVCQTKAKVEVAIWDDERVAKFYFDGGRMVHAVSGTRKGRDVAYNLIQFRRGVFKFRRDVTAPEQTVDIPYDAFFDQFQIGMAELFSQIAVALDDRPVAAELRSHKGALIARWSNSLALGSRLGKLEHFSHEQVRKLIDAIGSDRPDTFRPLEGVLEYLRRLQSFKAVVRIIYTDVEQTPRLRQWIDDNLEGAVSRAFSDALRKADRFVTARKPLILHIDDDSNIHMLVKFALANVDAEIITARDGQEGFRRALKDSPDLIILDLAMPGMNGFEACEKLKEHEKTKGTKILVLSGSDTEVNREIVLGNLKADAFLAKPFDRRQLVMTVLSLGRFEMKKR